MNEKSIEIKCESKEYYQLNDLIPFQGKLKSIDKDNFNKLKQSLIKDGLPLGFHIWKYSKGKLYIIDGHHRQLALKALQDEGYHIPSLPCTLVKAKNKKEAAKAVLVSNSKYAKMSQESLGNFMIDMELDFTELEFLDLQDFDLGDFWLNDKTKEGLTDDDAVPEVEQNIHNVKLGDIYQLGNHRLMCGDSTKIDDVEKLMNSQKADMVFTDPPYGIGIDCQKESINSNPKHNRKAHEFRGWDSKRPSKELFELILSLNVSTIIFGGNYFADLLPPSRGWIYWSKGQDGLTMSDGELAWTNQDKPLRSVTVNRGELRGSVHPTQKPISVVEFCLDYIKDSKSVLDLFGGSGSTLIACEKTNRKCFMMELDPHYCSVIIERWQQFTGQKAKLITE